jgi:hypothetical protein
LKRKGFISPAPPKNAPKEIREYMADTYAGLRKSKYPGESKQNKARAARITWYLTKKKYPDYFKKSHSRDTVSDRRHPKILKPVHVKPAKTATGRAQQVRELKSAAKREHGYAWTAQNEYHSELALSKKKSGVEKEDLKRDAEVAQGFSKDRDTLAHDYELQARRIAAIEDK